LCAMDTAATAAQFFACLDAPSPATCLLSESCVEASCQTSPSSDFTCSVVVDTTQTGAPSQGQGAYYIYTWSVCQGETRASGFYQNTLGASNAFAVSATSYAANLDSRGVAGPIPALEFLDLSQNILFAGSPPGSYPLHHVWVGGFIDA